MRLTWARDAAILKYADKALKVVCNVRNELNGLRLLSEKPVYSENEDGSRGLPYMPRQFPLGTWTVIAIIPKTDPYEAPQFISTDAHQKVHPWTTQDGHYSREMDDEIEDYGYGLHNSSSATTLGCGRIIDYKDREDLCAAIQAAWKNGETVTLEVV